MRLFDSFGRVRDWRAEVNFGMAISNESALPMTQDHDDIAAVQSLKSVPTIMRVISDTTEMRWVGIAKVTGET